MSLTFGELFAGIGGFSLGLERAGMTCKWQVEIDPYATAVLKKHWPEVPRHEDVRTFPPQGDWGVDVICGGFPCQDISVAGKGAGLAGARSGLWYEFARIIGELRPRYVVVENVAALLTRGMDAVLGTLSTLRYDAEWHVVPASAVGAPHRRERVWIVAYAIGQRDAVRGDGSPCSQGVAGRDCNAGRSQRDSGPRCAEVAGQSAGDVADAECLSGPQQQRDELRAGWQGHVGEGGGHTRGSQADGWWLAEPDVGGALDGFSSWLDDHKRLTRQSHGRIMAYVVRTRGESDANAKKKSASEIMRSLRDCFGEENVQRAAGGSVCVSAAEVLLAYLRKLEEGPSEEGNASLEGQEDEGAAVRGLRPGDKPSRTSHRPRRNKQHAGEYSDTLQDLSRLLALDSQAAWVAYRRSDACPRLNWESGIPRVAHGVSSRVDRLRCLGNAVVPQVVEVIGRAILAAEASMTA